MNALTHDDWRRLFELLDTALDLSLHERASWLGRLEDEGESLLPSLKELLDSREHIETRGFLAAPARPPAGFAVEAPPQLAAGTEVGPYRLLRPIGAGGMATVWLAERADGLIKRSVALKLPHASRFDRRFAERLARERDILAALDHSHIARLLDAGLTTDGQPYLALQYVDGTGIDAYCDERGLGIRQRLALFVQVARAVAYAHTHLVIHRDLKPSNVLVTADGRVFLLDFGIAKLLGADRPGEETALTQLAGRALTPDYASPEQILGAPLTTATDVYSLGVLLFRLLTGTRPYTLRHESPAALEAAIVAAEVRRPSTVVTDAAATTRGVPLARLRRLLAGDLDTIVLTALQKEPARRYASAGMLADDIERHLGGQAVLALPANRWYRARKFVVRHRVAVAAGSAVVVALAAGLGVALWQAHAAREQAARAEEIKRAVVAIFTSANPLQGGGADLRAVDLLAQARERIERELAGRDEMQVELLCTLAVSLSNLSAFAPARAAYEAALQRAAAVRAPQLDECRVDYAILLMNMDDMEGARRLMSEAEPAVRARGATVPLGKLLLARSALHRIEGRTEPALTDAQAGAAILRTASGDMSREYLNGLMQLGRIQYFAGRLEASVRTAEEGIQKLPQVLGSDHPDLPLFRVLRASALSDLGRHGEAAREFDASLPAIAKSFGEKSQEHIVDLHYYALVERNRGDLRHAIALSERALALARRAGLSKDVVAALLGALAVSQLAARQTETARQTAHAAETLASEALPPDHSTVVAARAARAYAAGLLGNLRAAKSELRTLIDTYREHEAKIAVPLRYLGELLLHEGDAASAAPLLARAADIADRGPSRLRAAIPAARTSLGLAMLALGNESEAEKHLRFALDALGRDGQLATPLRAEAQVGLTQVLVGRGQMREAADLAAEAVAFWREFDPAASEAREAASWHRRALQQSGTEAPPPATAGHVTSTR